MIPSAVPDPDSHGVSRIPILRYSVEIGYTLVDDGDLALVMDRCWGLSVGGYAQNVTSKTLMHRLIMGLTPGDGKTVDHMSRDKLDNRRRNLRIVSQGMNAQNGSSHRGASSKYRGVHWHSRTQQWRAMVYHDGHSRHIGYFEDELDAAQAADHARLAVMSGALEQVITRVPSS